MTSRRAVYVKVCGWAILAGAIGLYVFVAPRAGRAVNENKDFSHLWLGGRMIATDRAHDLYNPAQQELAFREADPQGRAPAVWIERNETVGGFFYPPPTALLYAPLARLPMTTAAVVMAYLNIALALACSVILSRLAMQSIFNPWIALAVLAYPGFFVSVSLGQNSVAVLLVILIVWLLSSQNRDFLAGLVAGLLICKPNWLVAVGWIPIVHGRIRMLAGAVCGVGLVLCGTLAVTGLGPFSNYVELLDRLSRLHELPGFNLDLTYNGLSLFRRWFGIGSTADLLGWLSSAVVLAVTWSVTRRRWRPGTCGFQHLVTCSLVAALWINPHLFYYDLLLTSACIVIAVTNWPRLIFRERLLLIMLAALAYAAIPWDQNWTWSRVLPMPCLVTVGLWTWFCLTTVRAPTSQ